MAKAIMVQGTMSNAGKSYWLRDFAGSLSRMDIVWLLLNHKIWH